MTRLWPRFSARCFRRPCACWTARWWWGGRWPARCSQRPAQAAPKIASWKETLKEARGAAEKAAEVERERIATDFHDGPLQSFISLQMRLEILRKLLERDFHAGMQDLQQFQALARAQVRDLRVFLHSMRPVDVDGCNLVSAARRTAESFQKESGIPVTFVGATAPVGLPGNDFGGSADGPRSTAQHTEACRGDARGGGFGKDRSGFGGLGGRQRPRIQLRGLVHAGRIEECCAWVRPA